MAHNYYADFVKSLPNNVGSGNTPNIKQTTDRQIDVASMFLKKVGTGVDTAEKQEQQPKVEETAIENAKRMAVEGDARKELETQRAEYQRQLDELNKGIGINALLPKAEAEIQENMKRAELQTRIDSVDEQLAKEYGNEERIGGTIRGWGHSTKGAYKSAAATVLDLLGQNATNFNYGFESVAPNIPTDTESKEPETFEVADRLRESAAKDIERGAQIKQEAKEGTSAVGGFMLDALSTGLDIGADTAISLIPGMQGAGLASMATRIFGNTAAESAAKGDDINTQVAKGVTAALIEGATEKIGGGFTTAYGGTLSKTLAQKFGKKAADTAAKAVNANRAAIMTFIRESGTEAFEEALSDVLNIAADHVFGWSDGEQGFLEDLSDSKSEILYDALLGGFVGMFGAVGEAQNVRNKAIADSVDVALENGIAKADGKSTDTARTASPAEQAVIKGLIDRGRVNNTTAAMIAKDPTLAAHFEATFGVTLEGTAHDKQTTIQRTVRDFAARQAQADSSAQAYADYQTAQNTQTAPEISVEQQLQSQADAQAKAKAQQAVDLLVGAINGKPTYRDAKAIYDDATLRSAWENATGIELPTNRNKAVEVIHNGASIVNQSAIDILVEAATPTTPATPTQPSAVDVLVEAATPPAAQPVAPAQASNVATPPTMPQTATDILTNQIIPPTQQNNAQAASTALKMPTAETNTEPFTPVGNLNDKSTVREGNWSANTLYDAETKSGITGENRTRFTYETKPEMQSVMEAAERLSNNRTLEVQRLTDAEAWSGTQTDMAMQIAKELYDSGDAEALANWKAIMNQHAIEGGRGSQAWAKYSRKDGQSALEAVIDALNENDSIPAEQKTEIINTATEKAKQYDEAVKKLDEAKGDNKQEAADGIIDLIKDVAGVRNTDTMIKGNLDKLLDSQRGNTDYLTSLAYNQIVSIANDVAAKKTFAEKVKTFQILSQLSSVATFNRNIGGNFSFGTVDTLTQNGFGVALDMLVSKATGKRTVSMDKSWFSSEARKGAVDALQKSALEIALDVDMGGANRYGVRSGRSFKMSGNAVDRFFSRWEQLLNYSLTTSDKFSRGQIEAETTRGLNTLKENGLTDAEIAEIAKQTADYRLFQNQGMAYTLSKGAHDLINLLGFGGKVTKHGRQGGFGVGDIVNPYPGVPANLGVKAFEYSPANIVKGGIELAKLMSSAKKGGVDAAKQNQAVMDIARGMAGVPIVTLFAAMFKAGLIKNWDDEEDYNVMSQNSAEGKTGVQINWDATTRWLNGEKATWEDGDTLDSIGWLEPINSFMAIGSLVAADDEDATFGAMAKDWASGALQGFLDIPVMSNIASAYDTARYSKEEKLDGKIADAVINYAGNSATGFIPSPIKGIASATDEYKRDTKGDTTAEAAVNSFKNSIPWLRETLPIKTDGYGNPITQDFDTVGRILNGMINPGNRSELKQSDVSAEVERLREETGIDGVYPDRKAPNQINIQLDGNSKSDKFELTADEKRDFHKVQGQKTNELYEELMTNPLWDLFDSEQKADMLKAVQSEATEYAKMNYADKKGLKYSSPIDILISGVDKPGKGNDIPPISQNNVVDYLMSDAMYKEAKKSDDPTQLDSVLEHISTMPSDIQATFPKKHDGFATRAKAYGYGINTADYEQFKADKEVASDIFDKTNGNNGVCELYALGMNNLSPETQKKIFDNQKDLGFLSDTAVKTAEIFEGHGWGYQDAANFIYTAMWDGRPDKNTAASGSMTNLQCAAAISQIPGLTERERENLYNEFKAVFSNKYNDWGRYTYRSEVDYVARNGYTVGRWGDMSTVGDIGKSATTTSNTSTPQTTQNAPSLADYFASLGIGGIW